MKEKPALSNPDEFPDDIVLRNTLDETYVIFEQLMQAVTVEPFRLDPEWRYYKDGHAWLCKVQYKKKTVFWLSVYDGYFKVAFYFSANLSEGIGELEIRESIKSMFIDAGMIGKVKPLVVRMDQQEDLEDVLRITTFKKKYL